MKMNNAIKTAKKIAHNRCSVSAHYGDNNRKDRAVRISGCFANEARVIGQEIAKAINGTLRCDAGFVAVWLEELTEAKERKMTKIKITVKYWVGTSQYSGTATTYAGAMRIASRNQNVNQPKFFQDDRELHDNGVYLEYDDQPGVCAI